MFFHWPERIDEQNESRKVGAMGLKKNFQLDGKEVDKFSADEKPIDIAIVCGVSLCNDR